MMNLIQSMIIAFSMYSKIPVPMVEWNEKNMKYAMCFFPLIGVIIGAAEYFVGKFLCHISVGKVLFASVMTLLPVIITGGIHLDGFMDTMDALGSYGDQNKKLEILKDSNSGAFAVLGMGCYFVWSMGIWSEVTPQMLGAVCFIYVISRALSAYSVVTFQSARKSGLAKTFQDGAGKKSVRITSVLWLLSGSALMILKNRYLAGASLICAALSFGYYRHICRKEFGGITGDLAGFFLQVCELLMLTGMVVTSVWK